MDNQSQLLVSAAGVGTVGSEFGKYTTEGENLYCVSLKFYSQNTLYSQCYFASDTSGRQSSISEVPMTTSWGLIIG